MRNTSLDKEVCMDSSSSLHKPRSYANKVVSGQVVVASVNVVNEYSPCTGAVNVYTTTLVDCKQVSRLSAIVFGTLGQYSPGTIQVAKRCTTGSESTATSIAPYTVGCSVVGCNVGCKVACFTVSDTVLPSAHTLS